MPELIRTARLTGLFYLGLAVTGALGFLTVRPRLFAEDDPAGRGQHRGIRSGQRRRHPG